MGSSTRSQFKNKTEKIFFSLARLELWYLKTNHCHAVAPQSSFTDKMRMNCSRDPMYDAQKVGSVNNYSM
jgi:hypothetical protein